MIAMSSVWEDADCQRPDPYIDWEYRTRPPSQSGIPYWCSVQIQVLAQPNGDYLPNLSQLENAVIAGRISGDPGGPNDVTIRMTNDELARLKRVIADKPRDAVEAQFFIYRP